AGVQLGLMPLASLSVSKDLMGEAFNPTAAGSWFANYTAALMFGAAIGGILLGNFGDRFGRVRGMALSIFCYAGFGAAGYFVRTQEQLLVLRFLTGLGVGGIWPNGVSIIAEFWSDVSRPMLAGMMGTAANLGILVMSQFGTLHKVTPDSWRWLMLTAAAAPALLAVLVWALAPESPKWLQSRVAGTLAPAKAPIRELFRPPLLGVTLVGICLGAIPLVGAWASSKWMIPWADEMGGLANPGYKATTQAYWSVGAAIGGLVGGYVGSLLGRRWSYFTISLFTSVITIGIFVFLEPLQRGFLPVVFVQGVIATMFFGWLPLYLPELFPTRVRATGTGITYNSGRFISAAGVLFAGVLVRFFEGDYARVGAITGLVYALGMFVIWWAPETKGKELKA
ncbi:MAG TPA: MFS transporter, partial [Candidatus Hydrogenedentes bacterium]|nr:MFS transporter [Candidatus Hydrogenedentota bacterium]